MTLVLLGSLVGLFAAPAEAQYCSATSTGNVPLTDLGIGTYNGYVGGLYPNGSNVRPAAHETAGLTMADAIQPLDAAGQVDPVNGRIGFVSIGMSLTNQEFEVFEYASAADPLRDPHITTVNGAQDGHSAFQWADPNHVSWSVLASAVAGRGLTAAQVQVAWIKQTVRGSDVGGWSAYPPFPAPALLFQTKLRESIQLLKDRYPNIRVAYLSSRIYGQYAISTNYPEPIAYEEGFAVKWLIEQQIAGDPALRFTGPDAEAPYLAWGPYLWADGLGSDGVVGGIPGRSDGLEYSCADFSSDGLHPSVAGRQKVADQLLRFLQTDTTSRRWYLTSDTGGPPPPPPPPGGGASHYVELDGVNDVVLVADHDSLSFTTGSLDRPLTFELWIRPDTMAVKQNLVSKWLEGPNQEYRFYISSNTLRLDLRDPSAQATVSAYTTASQAGLAGGWHHVAVSYDGRGGATAANGIAIYVDGVSLALTRANHAAYVAMENQTYALRLGHESSAFRQYRGGLDEVRIWNVVRTPTELQSGRTVELTGAEPGLVAYWRFNEGTGTTVADDAPGTLTATLLNGVLWFAGGPVSPRP
ncbi:MAG: LamG domain-containing protein [Vicinamibacterales bacterium]